MPTTDSHATRLRLLACLTVGLAYFVVGATSPALAQSRSAQRGGESVVDLHWWPVRKNIWMLVGAGTNIAASVGPDGVMLVNSGNAQASERVIAAVKDLQTQLNAFGFLDVQTGQRGGAETRSRFPVNTHAPPKPVRLPVIGISPRRLLSSTD